MKNLCLKADIRAVSPALAVLFANLIISTVITEFTYVAGLKELWKVLLRFLMLLLIVTLPLLLLPVAYMGLRGILNQRVGRFIQLKELKDYAIHPLKNWFLRPLQGIGLAMLIATKFLVLLKFYAGSIANATDILPPVQFNPWRLISVMSITAVTSLMLSVLWSLDDLGIRFYNRKTKEVKMVGKYVGLLLPVFFGFYGIINLFENYRYLEALQYIVQMVIIFYPPFVILGAIHSRYIEKRERLLLEKLCAAPFEKY